jgi:hypothetical protein
MTELTVAQYARVRALVRHFGADNRADVLRAIGLSAARWQQLERMWQERIEAELAKGETAGAEDFAASLEEARRELRDEPPKLEDLTPSHAGLPDASDAVKPSAAVGDVVAPVAVPAVVTDQVVVPGAVSPPAAVAPPAAVVSVEPTSAPQAHPFSGDAPPPEPVASTLDPVSEADLDQTSAVGMSALIDVAAATPFAASGSSDLDSTAAMAPLDIDDEAAHQAMPFAGSVDALPSGVDGSVNSLSPDDVGMTAALGVAALDVDDALPFEDDEPSSAPASSGPSSAPASSGPSSAPASSAPASSEPQSAPVLTLEQYASFQAELRVHPDQRADIYARYGVADATKRSQMEASYARAVAADPVLAERLKQLTDQYVAYLTKSGA